MSPTVPYMVQSRYHVSTGLRSGLLVPRSGMVSRSVVPLKRRTVSKQNSTSGISNQDQQLQRGPSRTQHFQLKQDAVGDGRLRPGAATWRTRRNWRVVFDSGPFAPLCKNMTSLTKRFALPSDADWATATDDTYSTENLVTFGLVVSEICEPTDRHTDTQIAINHKKSIDRFWNRNWTKWNSVFRIFSQLLIILPMSVDK